MIDLKTMQEKYEKMCPSAPAVNIAAVNFYAWLQWIATEIKLESLDQSQNLQSFQIVVNPMFVDQFTKILTVPFNFANPTQAMLQSSTAIATAICAAFSSTPAVVQAMSGAPGAGAAPAITAASLPIMIATMTNITKLTQDVNKDDYSSSQIVQAVHDGVEKFTWIVPMAYTTVPPTMKPLPLKVK